MDTASEKKPKPAGFILLVCMVLLIVIGTGMYLVRSSVVTPQKLTKTPPKPSCTFDTSVCTFLSKLSPTNSVYRGPISATITITKKNTPPQTDQVVFQSDAKDNLHIISAQNNKTNNEIILVGSSMYMKNLTTGAWQEQTSITTPMLSNFRQKALDQVKKSGKDTLYTFLDNEPCGTYTCMKYEVVSKTNGTTKEYIYFDTKEYILRKAVTQSPDTITEAVFAYTPLSITPPVTK